MRRHLLNLAAMTLLLACARCDDDARPTAATTSPAAAAPDVLRVRTGDYLARFEHTIRVSGDGTLQSERIENKSWGAGDIDPRHQRVERRRGPLTPQQRADVTRLLDDDAGWARLAEKFPAVADEPGLEVTCRGKTVSGGRDHAPEALRDLYARLSEWSQSIPLETPATPATAPAPTPKAATDDQQE